ncbi:cupredoxin domain-containing protein [Ornithinimicrobium sp. LYQ121]|uniref:cupredoxin domain-containing protein n=1 Tax=Ornithinimicrobium sp. LYQ121 TaxID=3378801 RepID=UPI003851A9C7
MTPAPQYTRPRHPRLLAATGTLALALAVLTACGGDADEDDPGAEVSTSSTTDASTTDASSDATSSDVTSDATSSGTTSSGATATADPSSTEATTELVIVISDFDYEVPDSVPPGAQITIRNEDSVGHTVTADDGGFDVVVGPGEQATLTAPAQEGEFPFHCTPHPAMTATLVVEG